MIAILSDIHSNLCALEAVLNDMPEVSGVYVLGDTVGGVSPFPCEVLDRLMGLNVSVSAILGNWENWMLKTRHDTLPQLAAHAWTMDTLHEHHWSYLEKLEQSLRIEDKLIFHGTPEQFRGEILCQNDAEELAKRHSAKWLIGGHTHRARLFRVGNQRVVNVGSVGLSCDNIGGGTACYALLDEDNISFRYVSYDVDAAVRAIEDSELYVLAADFAKFSIAIMRTGSTK